MVVGETGLGLSSQLSWVRSMIQRLRMIVRGHLRMESAYGPKWRGSLKEVGELRRGAFV
jgi:hypothetical protein